MKREEIKSLLDGVEGLTEDKVKSIIDGVLNLNGKEVSELKNQMKANEEKAKEYDTLVAKNEELVKGLEEAQGFKDKATKYDEILPKYEESLKTIKDKETFEKIKAKGFDDKFAKFVKSEVGEVEDYDSALEEYAKNNPQYLVPKVEKTTPPEFNGGNEDSTEDLSKIY
jgi:Zn-dependent M32 family carboxypeptidase